MTTMSDDGEKTCPLCAEEMDLTDQQLKPCKCGYEICVWCWHHINEMAEKEESEGRCPACRTPYDKERIVGMASNCEKVVLELNAEKKQKSQRAKPKVSWEARKHLNGVRVIKRNLVYIIGLPADIADESILERKEYFGQYGKVLKVSISRPANTTAVPQQAANNNTFSVYITYAREEEAIRCIQAVHNFVLEGKPLRACFGTTKYCHLWLRNMSCTNPDCLYLHDVGSQDDSFTKDEIISAYTRSRVPQSASNNLQRRAGHVLPPPVDDLCDNGALSGKHVVKSASNNSSIQVKSYANVSTCGKTPVLPAAASWGSRVSSCRPPAPSMSSSQHSANQRMDLLASPSSVPSIVESTKQTSAWHDDEIVVSKMPERNLTLHTNNNSRLLETINSDTAHASKISAWDDDIMHGNSSSRTETLKSSVVGDKTTYFDGSMDSTRDDAYRSAWDDDEVTLSHIPEGTKSVQMAVTANCSDTLKPSIDRVFQTPATEPKDVGIIVLGDNTSSKGSERRFISSNPGLMVDTKTENLCSRLASVNIDDHLGADQSSMDQRKCSVLPDRHRDLGSRLRNYYPEDSIGCLASASLANTSTNLEAHVSREGLFGLNSASQVHAPQCSGTVEDTLLVSHDINPILDMRLSSFRENGPVLPTAQRDELNSSELGRSDDVSNMVKTTSVDMVESSIVRDILSLDFDPWDDSLSSACNFAKLLGGIDKQDGPSKLSSSLKLQNSNESRFSFARQENQPDSLETYARMTADQHRLGSSEDTYIGSSYNFSQGNFFGGSIGLLNSNSVVPSDKTASVSRGRISTPPGFSVPSRAPPPGFSSHDRFVPSYETGSGLLGHSSLRNQYQVHPAGNASDVEFIDPAILAVGKGVLPLGVNNSGFGSRYGLPPQYSTSDNDSRLHLLKQQFMASAHRDQRILEHSGDRFLPSDDAYISSRLLAESHRQSLFAQIPQQPRASHIQLDGWNDAQMVNDMRMAEMLRSERLGLNGYFPVNEENKYHRTSSGDIYNRAFGM